MPTTPGHDGPEFITGFLLTDCVREGDESTFSVVVETDCPHCDDHFPGDPIVPAIAQLDLIASLARRIQPTIVPASIDTLRLSGAIRPDDRLTVHLTEVASGGRSRFRITRADDLLTEGTLSWTDEVPA